MNLWETHMKHLTPSQREAIARRFGHPVEDLGAGSLAHVWLMSSGKVAKITPSHSDAKMSAGVAGKQWPHVVRVYDVVRLGKGPLWMIVSERVTMLDNDPREFGELGRLYSASRMNYAFTMDEMRAARDKLKSLAPEPGYRDLHRQYIELIGSLLELGLPAHDIGPWNLGWRDHELVVFDLGGDEDAKSPDVEVLKNQGAGTGGGFGFHGSYMTVGEVVDWYSGSADPFMAAAALDLAHRLYGTADPEELMGVTAGSASFRRQAEALAQTYRRQGHG